MHLVITFISTQASNLSKMTEFTSETKHGNLQDVIFTSLEPMRSTTYVHQWLNLFVMFTMERSAVLLSVQVLLSRIHLNISLLQGFKMLKSK